MDNLVNFNKAKNVKNKNTKKIMNPHPLFIIIIVKKRNKISETSGNHTPNK